MKAIRTKLVILGQALIKICHLMWILYQIILIICKKIVDKVTALNNSCLVNKNKIQ